MNKHDIPVLTKAIRVLLDLAANPKDATPSSLARRLGIAQATCYRIVRTYEHAGWLRRNLGGYELSPSLNLLLQDQHPQRRLVEVAEPELRRVSEQLGLTVKLSVHSGDEAMTLLRCDPPTSMLTTGGTGTSFHLCYGSSGAAVAVGCDLAELQRVIAAAPPALWTRQSPKEFLARVSACRRHGYCVDRGSFHPDVHSVSVPVADGPRILAAISALALPNDLPDSRIAPLGQMLLKAAGRCVERLHERDRQPAPPEPAAKRVSRNRVQSARLHRHSSKKDHK